MTLVAALLLIFLFTSVVTIVSVILWPIFTTIDAWRATQGMDDLFHE